MIGLHGERLLQPMSILLEYLIILIISLGWLIFNGLKGPSRQGAKDWFSNDLIEIFKPITYLRPYLYPV